MPGLVPNVMIAVKFHDGPKANEVVQFAVPVTNGAPDRIQIVGVNPETGETRHGEYRQTAFSPFYYVWTGWQAHRTEFIPLTRVKPGA